MGVGALVPGYPCVGPDTGTFSGVTVPMVGGTYSVKVKISFPDILLKKTTIS